MVAAMGVEATAVAPAVVMAAEAKAAVAEMAMGVAKVGSEAGGRRRQPVMTMGGAASNQGKNQLRQ